MPAKIDNKPPAKKRGNPNWKKGGASPNPRGAPKRGESWTETIKSISEMTPVQAAEWCNQVAGKLKSIGDDVSLKQAVTLRVFAALMFDPQPGLFNAVMERAEGSVKNVIEGGDPDKPIRIRIEYADDSPTAPSSGTEADQESGEAV